ncbi:MAG: class I SAM-dependent methyltransferase [Comamonadaceae bacterium]|nr:class I SAM-dependent methyltransferase [Comamonadaceae bacterium]
MQPARRHGARASAAARRRPRRRRAPARLERVSGGARRAATSASPRAYIDGDWTTPRPRRAADAVHRATATRSRRLIYGTLAGASLRTGCGTCCNRNTRRRQPAATSTPTTTWATTSTALWLDPTMTYSQRAVRRRRATHACADGAARQGTRRALRRARRARRASRVLEIGCGWGALGRSWRRASPARRSPGVTLSHRAARLRAASALARPGRPSAPTCELQDYRDVADGRFDAHRLDRDVRGGRRASTGRRYFDDRAAAAQARRPRLHPDHHHRATTLFERYRARHRLHPAVHLPRRHAALRRSASAPRRRRRGLARRATSSPSAPTTPRRCAAGAQRFLARETQVRELGFDDALHAHLATSTSPTARPAFAPATPTCVQFDAGARLMRDRDHAAPPARLTMRACAAPAAPRLALPAQAPAAAGAAGRAAWRAARAAAGCAGSACRVYDGRAVGAGRALRAELAQPFALALTVRPRASTARAICRALSVERDAAPGLAATRRSSRAGRTSMARVFPDVREGDTHRRRAACPARGARFFHQRAGRRGEVARRGVRRARFFGIWLDASATRSCRRCAPSAAGGADH